MSRLRLLSRCKDDLLHVYSQAIEAIKPDRLMKNTIAINNNTLLVKRGCYDDLQFDLTDSNVHLIGGGKSVLGMACGIAQIATDVVKTDLFSHGCLSLPIGLASSYEGDEESINLLKSIGVKCHYGSANNLPDEDAIKASRTILEQIKEACRWDVAQVKSPLFVVLVSGGGSACLTHPRYIDLDKKLELISYLVKKGADIIELNNVRRYFSSIKGGQLAKYILECHPKSRVLSLIMSDVIGDPVEFIASGPTYLEVEGTHSKLKQSMLKVLDKYGYPIEGLLNLCDEGSETCLDFRDRIVVNHVIGNNRVALEASVRAAVSLGYEVRCIGNCLQGYTDDVAERLRSAGNKIYTKGAESRILIVGGGETVIRSNIGDTWGKGGRAQEMALDYIISLLKNGAKESESVIDFFLAGGTDGQDGPTDAAACLVSAAEYFQSGGQMFSLEDALKAKESHDSYNFWSRHKPDWLIKTGLTGTNVMDLYMYMLATNSE